MGPAVVRNYREEEGTAGTRRHEGDEEREARRTRGGADEGERGKVREGRTEYQVRAASAGRVPEARAGRADLFRTPAAAKAKQLKAEAGKETAGQGQSSQYW